MPFIGESTVATSQTGNDVLEEALRLLLSGQREQMNVLATNVDANATTLNFLYELEGIRAGSLINIDLETYRVWSVEEAGRSAQVQPAMDGTLSSNHSAGSLVYVNPHISKATLFKAINDEILSLSAEGLYGVDSYEFPFEGARTEYEIAGTNLLDVFKVQVSLPGPENRWRPVPYRFAQSSDTTAFPSGQSLFMTDGIPGRTVRVLYRRGFSRLASPNDDLELVAGVPPEMQDILAIGALARTGIPRELKRNFTESQGDTRRAEEVQSGAGFNSFRNLLNMRQMRIQAERERLIRKWGLFV